MSSVRKSVNSIKKKRKKRRKRNRNRGKKRRKRSSVSGRSNARRSVKIDGRRMIEERENARSGLNVE